MDSASQAALGSDSPTSPPLDVIVPRPALASMTRDHQRDLEAHGGIIVARYCAECGRAIPIEDERTEARDWRAHLERHRQREKRSV